MLLTQSAPVGGGGVAGVVATGDLDDDVGVFDPLDRLSGVNGVEEGLELVLPELVEKVFGQSAEYLVDVVECLTLLETDLGLAEGGGVLFQEVAGELVVKVQLGVGGGTEEGVTTGAGSGGERPDRAGGSVTGACH